MLGVRGTAWFLSPTFMVTAEMWRRRCAFRRELERARDCGGGEPTIFALPRPRCAFGGRAYRKASPCWNTDAFLRAESLPIRIEPLAPESGSSV